MLLFYEITIEALLKNCISLYLLKSVKTPLLITEYFEFSKKVLFLFSLRSYTSLNLSQRPLQCSVCGN